MKRLFLILVILFLGGHASAQETNELPVVEGFIFKWENEIVFPEGVRFRLTVSRSAEDLAATTLTIEPVGLTATRVDMNLDEPIATDPNFTEFDFVWPFPDGFAPRLFRADDVLFEWQAVDKQGETASVRDALRFTDPRAEWVQSEDAQGFLNLTVPAGDWTPDRVRQSIRLPYNLMAANVGRNLTFNIILYPPNLDPSGCESVKDEETDEEVMVALGPRGDSRLPCDPAQAAAVFAASGLSVVQSRGATINGAQATLVDFLARQFYEPMWAGAEVPGWFLPGLTQFYSPANKARWLLPVRDLARTNRLRSLNSMAGDSEADDSWQAQSYAMVLYVADQIGVEGLFDLANAADSAPSFAEAYAQAVGQDIQTLLPNLRRWVFSEAAANAFNYTPYMAETPVPTASRTPSPFPPTATHTATATAPPTLTPSVTGVLSPTPTSTSTPSRTPTPRPATVTPRPAGSLFTPTPTPAPGLLDHPVDRLGTVAALLILAAIVGLVYVIIGRRDA